MNILLHIPHASRLLPDVFHQGLRLTEAELSVVLTKHTDSYTDLLFGRSEIPSVVASYSRLYCDVERFVDDRIEPMSRFGQGVVYTHSFEGKRLHDHDEAYKQEALKYYYSHHQLLDDWATLLSSGNQKWVMLDCHSFSDELASYVQTGPFSDVCIGTEPDFFDERVYRLILKIVKSHGYSVAIDHPYKGALIPNVVFQNRSIQPAAYMIELNKRIYLSEDGTLDSINADKVKRMLDEIYEGIKNL